MLGGGNPVSGGTPTGTGTILSYVGNHVSGHSGVVTINNVETTMIQSIIPSNNYVIVKIQGFYAVAGDTTELQDDYRFRVSVDDELLLSFQYKANNEFFGPEFPKLLVVGGSTLKVTCTNVTDTSSNDMGCIITGRVY